MKIPGASAVLTGIALVAFISLVTFVTLFTDCSGSLYAGVDFSDPPVAVFSDKRCFTVFAVPAVLPVGAVLTGGAVFTVYTVFTVNAVSAIRTF